VGDDLLVARAFVGVGGGEFESIESTLAGERLAAILGANAILAERIALADGDGEESVVAKSVVIDEVLVSQAEAEDALLEEIAEGMFEAVGMAIIGEAIGELIEEVEVFIEIAQEQGSRVGGDAAAIEIGEDLAAIEGLESDGGGNTLCHTRPFLLARGKWLVVQTLTREGAVGFCNLVRKAG